MVTVAPGTTDPDGSVTAPLIEPELDCAWTVQNIAENTNTDTNERMLRVGMRMRSLLRFLIFETELLTSWQSVQAEAE
jgi:hypothetical protein